MQASQSRNFAAAQDTGRGVGGRTRLGAGQTGVLHPALHSGLNSRTAEQVSAASDAEPFFTPTYFRSLRPQRETSDRAGGPEAGRPKAARSEGDRPGGGVGPEWYPSDSAPDRRARTAHGGAGGAAGLAHDAGNLLSALSLYSELLACPNVLAVQHRHYAADLKLLAERSGSLIDRLVALGAAVDEDRERGGGQQSLVGAAGAVGWDAGRHGEGDGGEGGRRPSDAACSNLVDVLTACGGVLSTLAGGALEVTMGSQAGLPIPVRQEALERILVNLVKNAALAVRQGGSIRIQAGLTRQTKGAALGSLRGGGVPAANRRRMALTVDDSGCGMSAAKLAELNGGSLQPSPGQGGGQQPGLQSVAGRRGIGLQVVRELVEASGGSFRMESREGVGTRIEVEWPPLTPGLTPELTAPAASVSYGLGTASGYRAENASGYRPENASGYRAGIASGAASGMVDRMEMVAESEPRGLNQTRASQVAARSRLAVRPEAETRRRDGEQRRGKPLVAGPLVAKQIDSEPAEVEQRGAAWNRTELTDAALTEAERRMLIARSNRPVIAAESVVREAAMRAGRAGGRMGRLSGLMARGIEQTIENRSLNGFGNGSGEGLGSGFDNGFANNSDNDQNNDSGNDLDNGWGKGLGNALGKGLGRSVPPGHTAAAASAAVAASAFENPTLDRSFAGSLHRSLDRERQRAQQRLQAGNEGAIAC